MHDVTCQCSYTPSHTQPPPTSPCPDVVTKLYTVLFNPCLKLNEKTFHSNSTVTSLMKKACLLTQQAKLNRTSEAMVSCYKTNVYIWVSKELLLFGLVRKVTEGLKRHISNQLTRAGSRPQLVLGKAFLRRAACNSN